MKDLNYRKEKEKYYVKLKLTRAEQEKLDHVLDIYKSIYLDYCKHVIVCYFDKIKAMNFKHYYLTQVLPMIRLSKKDPTSKYYYISTNIAYETVKEAYNYMIRYKKYVIAKIHREDVEYLDEILEKVIIKLNFNNFKMFQKDYIGLHLHRDKTILYNLQNKQYLRLFRFGKIKADKKDIKDLPFDITDDIILYYYLHRHTDKKGKNEYELCIAIGNDKIYRDEDDFIYLKHKDLIRKEQQG